MFMLSMRTVSGPFSHCINVLKTNKKVIKQLNKPLIKYLIYMLTLQIHVNAYASTPWILNKNLDNIYIKGFRYKLHSTFVLISMQKEVMYGF